MINIYIGYDSSNYGQQIAFEVCKRSLLRYNKNLNIFKLDKKDLISKKIYLRDNDNDGSTEFTYTRFLVPFLNNYEGYAIFCDSDFLWRTNIEELKQFFDDTKSVICVKHDYKECNSNTKMDGLQQEWYPRKNWSSFMIFNCGHSDCKNLDINNIKIKSAKWLHRMEWTNDSNIKEINKTYNYLLGYYNDIENPKAIHMTDGGPWYNDWYLDKNEKKKIYEIEWLKYLNDYEKDDLRLFLKKI